MKFWTFLPAATMLIFSTQANAEDNWGVVSDCGHWDALSTIPEPFHENTATFANGKIRVTNSGTGEPVCCGFTALITIADDTQPDRQCFALTSNGEKGFMATFAQNATYVELESETLLFVPVHLDPAATGAKGYEINLIKVTIDLDPPSASVVHE